VQFRGKMVSRTEQAVLHVGPDIRTTGGMASVVGLLVGAGNGSVSASHAATWHPRSRIHGLVPTLRVISRLVTRPASRPTWLHAHLSEGGSFVREGAVVVVARALGIGTAATLHGAEFIPFAQAHPSLVRAVLRRCDTVFPLGPHAAETVRALCPDAVVRPVVNPVDLAELDGAVPSPRRSTVVLGGEIGRRKGVDRLVQAWPAVRERHPDATCLLCGPLGDVPVDELPEGMTYAGSVPRTELLGLLKSADLACLPSRHEALPMFVLESLGLGVPVVTTPVGEIDQLGERQGVALTDGDPARLAARINDFLDDPGMRTDWGRRATAWARTTCAVESVVHALESAYREDASGLRPAQLGPVGEPLTSGGTSC
jgi:glycosyltransferase involved in cell wall biosynthesis